MSGKNIVLIDCEDINWKNDLLLPFWVVFDGKYKYRLSVKRDKDVEVCLVEARVEDDMSIQLDKSCYKFQSYEVWTNDRYYHIEDSLVDNTDRLRFINVVAKGEGHARIIFEQISNDNNLPNSVDLDEID